MLTIFKFIVQSNLSNIVLIFLVAKEGMSMNNCGEKEREKK